MSTLHAHASAVIDASPETIYGLIADYRAGHPQILPQKYFRDLIVEEGGYGAGTVIRFTTRAGGKEVPYRMIVTEPEPGRVLVETDTAPASSLATTFTVAPVAGGAQARVEIATEWEASRGFAGLMERLLYPVAMRRIYRQELRQIGVVTAERGRAPVTA
jgi:hypothetical protein